MFETRANDLAGYYNPVTPINYTINRLHTHPKAFCRYFWIESAKKKLKMSGSLACKIRKRSTTTPNNAKQKSEAFSKRLPAELPRKHN